MTCRGVSSTGISEIVREENVIQLEKIEMMIRRNFTPIPSRTGSEITRDLMTALRIARTDGTEDFAKLYDSIQMIINSPL